jgi:probable DNA metabolism protein
MPNGVVFDGTYEGFLTVIYKYYYEKLRVDEIVEEGGFQQTLSMEYANVETDYGEADKALAGIREKLGDGIQKTAYMAFVNNDPNRFTYIFRYLIMCFKHGPEFDGYMQYECVIKTKHAAGRSGKDVGKLAGFARFEMNVHGILYSVISPDSDILPMLADFFADRFLGERWVIHDIKRSKAAAFDGKEWIMADAPDYEIKQDTGGEDDIYKDLWKAFYDTLAIKERTNPKVQRQHMPKRYWKHMTEHRRLPG